MALAAPKSPTQTYEEYMAEPVIVDRYDIIEGVRYFMSAPTWEHQRILKLVSRLLDRYEVESGTALSLFAPLDILIRRTPRLQIRQPDALLISRERLAQGGGAPAKGPLTIGPELVVEIVSDTEREQMLQGKLADYAAVGVQEAWVVRPATRTVEVMRVSPDEISVVAVFTDADQLRSEAFADLFVPVADIFAH